MNNPFFSIVIPAYNRAFILPQTIGSVISQTFSDWELIVVDDGSEDNTLEVVQSINDKRIHYVYQNNAERSAARNKGIAHSKGQYICFLDSDDLFENNHLQILFDYIVANNNPVEFIFTNCFYLVDDKKEKPDLPPLEKNPIAYFLQNSVIPARICIHKDILSEFMFREDIVIVEDTVLWATIANKYPVKHIEDYTVQYRIYEDNSVNIKNNCFLPRLKGLKKLFGNKEISKKAGKKMIAETLSTCYLGIARHYEYKRLFFKMTANLFMSFIRQPFSDKNKFKVYMVYKFLFKKNEAPSL